MSSVVSYVNELIWERWAKESNIKEGMAITNKECNCHNPDFNEYDICQHCGLPL